MKKFFIYTISAIVFLLYASPAFASTVSVPVGSNIEVTNMTQGANGYIITGQNLPQLTDEGGKCSANYAYQNFAIDLNASGYIEGLNPNNGGCTDGLWVVSDTSTEISFSPYTSLNGNVWSIYLAPAGTQINESSLPPNGTDSPQYVGTYNGNNNTFYPAITEAPIVSVTSESPTSISLSWNSIPGAQTYNIYENGSSTPVMTGITETTATVSGLSPGIYSLQVAGVGPSGAGPLSTDVLAQTATPLPAVTVNAGSNLIGGIEVSWTQETGAVDYNVEVNGSLDVPDYTGDSITLSNYPLNTPVSIVVYPLDQYGNVGIPSATVNATPTLAGPKLSYGNLTSKSVTLNWTAVPGATSYQVYENDPTLVASTISTTTTINNLQPGQTYSFTVNAVTPNGDSLSSSPVNISPQIFNMSFSGTDVLNNSLTLLGLLSSLILLALAVEFTPQIISLIKTTTSKRNQTAGEYDSAYPTAKSPTEKKIEEVDFEG